MGELIDSATQTSEFGFELDLDPNIKDDDDGCGRGSSTSSPRVEIDTSAPFGSVAEAVIRFGGHGFWIPQHLLPSSSTVSTSGASAALNPDDIIDVIKLDQDHLPTQILKDLTLKQQETLDVFMNELNHTKTQIKELELKLLNNSSSSESIPAAISSPGCSSDNSSSLCAQKEGHFKPPGEGGGKVGQVTSELNQAKLNLSQSTSELASIRAAVESLSWKLEQEGKSSTSLKSSSNHHQQQQQSSSIEKNIYMMIDNNTERSNYPPQSLTINNNHHYNHICPDTTIGSSSSSRRSSDINNKNHTNPVGISRELRELNHEADQFMRTAEAAKAEVSRAMQDIERTKTGLKMIELRWAAAKKMEEAAHAAEQLALAEIRAISSNGCDSASSLRQEEQGNKKMMISLSLEEYNNLAEKAARGAEQNLRFPLVDQNQSTRGGRGRDKEVMRKMALEQFMGRAEVADRRRLVGGTDGARRRDNNQTRGRRLSTVQMMTRDCNNSIELSSSFLSRNLSLQGGLSLLEDANEVNCGEEDSRKGVLKPATTSIGDVLRRKKQVVWRDDLDLGRGWEGEKERESSRVSLNQMLRNHRAHNFPAGRLEQRSHEHDRGNGKHLFWKKMKGLGFVHVSLPLSKARSREQGS